MGQQYDALTPELSSWIGRQHLFFVATAPLQGGHPNCSPKGLDTFTVVNAGRVTYLDLLGSGVETIAHLRENGRIVLMFCAFDGPPQIVRIYGRGTAIQVGDSRYPAEIGRFSQLEPRILAGARSVVSVEIDRVATSCGHGVPLMTYEGDRKQIPAWVDNRLRKGGSTALVEYQVEKNLSSVDGLPGLDAELLSARGGEV
jgi:hypothetical protein